MPLPQKPFGGTGANAGGSSVSPQTGGGGIGTPPFLRFRLKRPNWSALSWPAWLSRRNVARIAGSILIAGIILGLGFLGALSIYYGIEYFAGRPGKLKVAFTSKSDTMLVGGAKEKVKITSLHFSIDSENLGDVLDIFSGAEIDVPADTEFAEWHKYLIGNFTKPGTRYFYKVVGVSPSGKEYAAKGNFETPAAEVGQPPSEGEPKPAEEPKETRKAKPPSRPAEEEQTSLDAENQKKIEALQKSLGIKKGGKK